ncbi:MAG TPA: MFS transporter [Gemmatales bacterium]|nr:MFS transporter [Gemmatales bacterium]HMP59201.1 MFS transporter [Gemmatales bacterium]
MHRRWLFVASCIALITSAFTFNVRGEILQEMGDAFKLSQENKGAIEGAVFLGMAISMVIGGFICDFLGIKRIMWLAFFCHLTGVAGTIFAPWFVGTEPRYPVPLGEAGAFWWLYSASLLMGFGNGMTETGINPLVATLYPDKKTHMLNILHAWWPGGLIIGGLAVLYLRTGIDLQFFYVPGLNLTFGEFASWQVALLLIAAPCLIYGVMLIGQQFPETERVAAGVSTREMLAETGRPLFLILAFCMLLTASTELGPQKWQESVMSRTAHVSGTMILVYTSGLMFVLRHFAGPLAHVMSPIGMMAISSALAAVGLYLLSTATTAGAAFGYATIFGLGIAYFWPTMLGVTAERFPKGGALLLCLMGSAGNLAISQVLPQMGKVNDHFSVSRLKEDDAELAKNFVKDGSIDQSRVKTQLDPLAMLTPAQRTQLAEMVAASVPEAEAKLTGEKRMLARERKVVLDNIKNLTLTKDQRTLLSQANTVETAEAHGAAISFRLVSILPLVLVVIFGGIYIYDAQRGGYKAETLGH